MTESDTLAVLQKENARQISLLEANGIEWRLAPEPEVDQPPPLELESSRLSTDDKIALFRRLLRGRADVYLIFATKFYSGVGWPHNAKACP